MPARSASRPASATTMKLVWHTMLCSSLMVCPAPLGPTCVTVPAIASNTGLQAATASSAPPTISAILAVSAPIAPPDMPQST